MLNRTESRIKLEPSVIPGIAGFISALVEITLMWPCEYAKTMQQLNRKNPSFRVVKHMRDIGLVKVYEGLTPLLIGAPVQGLIRFTSLGYFNNVLADDNGKVSRFSGLIAGVSAGVLESVICVTPMETVKTVLVDSKQGLISGVRQVIQKDGVKGLYKGVSATTLKSASNQSFRFVIYNEYKRFITQDRKDKSYMSPGESLVGGMLAGFLGAVGNTPFDTLKSRMQGLESKRYNGVVDCARKMVTEEGVLSLYKGLWFRCSRVVPGQGIMFFTYEFVSDKLRKFHITNKSGKVNNPHRIQRMNSIGSE
jgi:solute carrier family 25 citrate transporter 1